MDGKIDNDMLLPGFRFHPTDEELLEFYLKRKIQHHPIPAELIKQVDIYKYDPCDLPKLTSAGDKEWYFFCPRERKYKNSVRPNRVTAWGFWKATGTDRPIYSTLGIKLCIGFKKSLVFYRGKAAKCMKTDWMMHEFRLVPTSDCATRITGKNIPAADSLTLCRIFKKAIPMVNMDRSFRNEDQFNSDTFSFNHETIFTSSDMQHFHRNDQISANGGATSTSRTDVASSMFHNPSHQSRNYGFISFEEQQLLQADSSHVVQEIVDVDNEEFSYNLLSAESESWK